MTALAADPTYTARRHAPLDPLMIVESQAMPDGSPMLIFAPKTSRSRVYCFLDMCEQFVGVAEIDLPGTLPILALPCTDGWDREAIWHVDDAAREIAAGRVSLGEFLSHWLQRGATVQHLGD